MHPQILAPTLKLCMNHMVPYHVNTTDIAGYATRGVLVILQGRVSTKSGHEVLTILSAPAQHTNEGMLNLLPLAAKVMYHDHFAHCRVLQHVSLWVAGC